MNGSIQMIDFFSKPLVLKNKLQNPQWITAHKREMKMCTTGVYCRQKIFLPFFFLILEAKALRKYLYRLGRINHCKCNWAKQQCLDVVDWVLFSFTCKSYEESLWVHTVHDCQSLGQRPQNKEGCLSIMHESCMQGVRRHYEWIIHLSMKIPGIKISLIEHIVNNWLKWNILQDELKIRHLYHNNYVCI